MVIYLLILLATFASSIQAADAAPMVPTATRNMALAGTPVMGVNLSGCEFALNGALCPTPASERAYLYKGSRAFCLPFRSDQAADPSVVEEIKAAKIELKRGTFISAKPSTNLFTIVGRSE